MSPRLQASSRRASFLGGTRPADHSSATSPLVSVLWIARSLPTSSVENLCRLRYYSVKGKIECPGLCLEHGLLHRASPTVVQLYLTSVVLLLLRVQRLVGDVSKILLFLGTMTLLPVEGERPREVVSG